MYAGVILSHIQKHCKCTLIRVKKKINFYFLEQKKNLLKKK